MKKILISTMLLGAFASAGGEFMTPIDETKDKEVVLVGENGNTWQPNPQKHGAYVGLGIGKTTAGDLDGVSASLILGYLVSDYIGLEFRYNTLLSDAKRDGSEVGEDIANAAVYLKQLLPINEFVRPYALLGYGKTTYGSLSDSQFQWGAGLDFQYTEQLGFTFDYESFYNGNFEDELADDVDVKNLKVSTRYSF